MDRRTAGLLLVAALLAFGAMAFVFTRGSEARRRLAGAPDVLGRRIELSGTQYEIVGVAPDGFLGTIPGLVPEFWAPLMMTERLSFQGIQSETPSPGVTVTVNPAGSSIFGAVAVPDYETQTDPNSVELGVKFTASSNGNITGLVDRLVGQGLIRRRPSPTTWPHARPSRRK